MLWLLSIILAALSVKAVEVPAGTEIHVRLKNRVTTNGSKPNEPVEAIVIEPILAGGKIVVSAGSMVRGIVKEAQPVSPAHPRAILDLAFNELSAGGLKSKLASQVVNVDNARETVDEKGDIVGILASESLSGRMDQGISKVAQKYAGLADVLQAAKGVVLKSAEGEIVYEPGVEMTLKLIQPLQVRAGSDEGAAARLTPVRDESALIEAVTSQPFRTVAENPPQASDITNLMFIGTQQQLESAFTAAGWSTAAALSAQSKLETFRAIAEMRGYKEAPVSTLLLEGRPPDLVYQKQNNTFALRHHLRVWRRPGSFDGKPIWVCAATHDVGIDFSEENKTFIHRIDPQIDRERAKVVNDLLFTGQVKSLALVERPAVPHTSQNATGDQIQTDGQMAVLIF